MVDCRWCPSAPLALSHAQDAHLGIDDLQLARAVGRRGIWRTDEGYQRGAEEHFDDPCRSMIRCVVSGLRDA